MAGQHQGVIQATINTTNCSGSVCFSNRDRSRTQIFIIRDQDREVLVNKKQTGAAFV